VKTHVRKVGTLSRSSFFSLSLWVFQKIEKDHTAGKLNPAFDGTALPSFGFPHSPCREQQIFRASLIGMKRVT